MPNDERFSGALESRWNAFNRILTSVVKMLRDSSSDVMLFYDSWTTLFVRFYPVEKWARRSFWINFRKNLKLRDEKIQNG